MSSTGNIARTGPTALGRYRLVRHLATGGMGEVYLAEAMGAAGFAKRVVVKTLRADLASDGALAQQLIAEGRLLEVLDHPNIAQILDLGCIDGEWFLAIEVVAGFDLRALRRALPAERGGRFRLHRGGYRRAGLRLRDGGRGRLSGWRHLCEIG